MPTQHEPLETTLQMPIGLSKAVAKDIERISKGKSKGFSAVADCISGTERVREERGEMF